MDRPELRFRILFEYYQEFHHAQINSEKSADDRVQDMDIEKNEKNAAKIWLIDSKLLEGSNMGHMGSPIPIPFIGRINSTGINYVEYVMDKAFTKIKSEFKDLEELSKTERIKVFAKHCINNPITDKMCTVTCEAIVKCMTDVGTT